MGKKSEETIEKLDAEIAALKERRNTVFELMTPLQKESAALYKKITALAGRRTKLKIKTNSFTLEELLNCDHYEDGDMVKYNEVCHQLEKLGLQSSGFNDSETGQIIVQVNVPDDATANVLKKIKNGIKTVLPILKTSQYFKSVQLPRCVCFRIMEYTLSENGCYDIAYDPKTEKWHLVLTRYGCMSVLNTYDNIDDLLLKLKKDHPYPKQSNDQDDQDDQYY